MRKCLALLVLLTAAFGFAGCGGDSVDTLGSTDASNLKGDDKAAYDAIYASLGEDEGDLSSEITDEQKSCVSAGMVKTLGAKRVLEVSDEDEIVLTESEAGKAADAFLKCVDMQKMFAAEFSADGTISEKSATCLSKKIDKTSIRKLLVTTFQGQEADLEADVMGSVLSGMADCLSADELKQMGN